MLNDTIRGPLDRHKCTTTKAQANRSARWPSQGFLLKHRHISRRQILNQAGKFLGNFLCPTALAFLALDAVRGNLPDCPLAHPGDLVAISQKIAFVSCTLSSNSNIKTRSIAPNRRKPVGISPPTAAHAAISRPRASPSILPSTSTALAAASSSSDSLPGKSSSVAGDPSHLVGAHTDCHAHVRMSCAQES